VLTCNILFYSITTLSNSITSTQNVFRFIYENKDSDYELFKHELELLDLYNKLKIIESLIYDIIHKYCESDEEFNNIKENIKNPKISSDDNLIQDYVNVNLEEKYQYLQELKSQ